MDIIDLLSTDGYIIVNKTLIKELGLVEATIFGLLCSEYNYYRTIGQLNCDMFYCTIDKLTEYTGLTYHRQQNAIKNLEEKGVISVIIEGMPATRYFKINVESVFDLFKNSEKQVFENFKTSFQKNEKLVFENFNTNNNISNKNEINNNTSKDDNSSKTNDVLEKLKKDIQGENHTTDAEKKKFLGSAKKTDDGKKESRYSQCVKVIDTYIADCSQKDTLKELLIQYLKMLFEDKNKQPYLNQWRGLLSKLQTLIKQGNDPILVVTKSIEKGYKGFYPINQRFNPGWDMRDKDNSQELIDAQNEVNTTDDISQQVTIQKFY